ncbi:secretory lipase-domain-containing protein [Scheffersomyces amazonensis]|uniref:secretory lipase-domain-containing protein n=1 Tax=Scheffersomyces amazonensis TaxID=1078765 RepID=UPI00315D55A4
MRNWLISVVCLLFLFGTLLVEAAPVTVLTPTEDPFYTAPNNLDDYKLGDIIRSRISPHPIRSIYFKVDVKSAWQLLVRSEDTFGNATAIGVTVIEPYNSNKTRLLSYQVAEDSASPNCAMSYAFQYGASMNTLVTQFEMYFIQAALDLGWYVTIPDYEGPQAAFTAGRQAGHAVLDGIRATLHSGNITGVDENAQLTMWGYSGGSLATGWAAALQPDYAPELKDKILGAALGGFVTNITATLDAQNGKIFAGLLSSGINGLMQEYPQLNELVRSKIASDKLEDFLYGSKSCMLPSLYHFMEHNFFYGEDKYFTDGPAILSEPIVQEILSENTLALHNNSEIPEIPLFVYHGELDRIVPIVGSERAYNNWCDWGIKSFEFAPDLLNGHITEFVLGAPAALAWLVDRYEGIPPVDGCKKTERISNLMYPGASEANKVYFEAAYTSLLGLPIGPDSNLTFGEIASKV